jgi:hypothetical protein
MSTATLPGALCQGPGHYTAPWSAAVLLSVCKPDGSLASIATGCCTEPRLKMVSSLLLVLARLTLPLSAGGVPCTPAPLCVLLGCGVAGDDALTPALPPTALKPPALRRRGAASASAPLPPPPLLVSPALLSVLVLRPLPPLPPPLLLPLVLAPLMCPAAAAVGRSRTSPLRLRAAGPCTAPPRSLRQHAHHAAANVSAVVAGARACHHRRLPTTHLTTQMLWRSVRLLLLMLRRPMGVDGPPAAARRGGRGLAAADATRPLPTRLTGGVGGAPAARRGVLPASLLPAGAAPGVPLQPGDVGPVPARDWRRLLVTAAALAVRAAAASATCSASPSSTSNS